MTPRGPEPHTRSILPPPAIEPLWTVRKGQRLFHAQIFQNHQGYEVRFVSDGQWFATQSFASREHAVWHADLFQRDLLTEGWVKTTR
jgi:hypothetical protein